MSRATVRSISTLLSSLFAIHSVTPVNTWAPQLPGVLGGPAQLRASPLSNQEVQGSSLLALMRVDFRSPVTIPMADGRITKCGVMVIQVSCSLWSISAVFVPPMRLDAQPITNRSVSLFKKAAQIQILGGISSRISNTLSPPRLTLMRARCLWFLWEIGICPALHPQLRHS